MRTTVTLDDDVFEAAKELARTSGNSLGEVISTLARRGLRAQPTHSRKNGLPVFKVAADAAIIPGGRAGELMADDTL